MTQASTNVSCTFLVLFLFSFLAAQSSGVINAIQIPCALPDEFSSTLTSQETNLTLIPGHTQKLTINLKAQNDDIVFEFISNITHPSLFQLSTFVNGNLESTSLANFIEPETLTILFDEQTKACFISGDKGFSSTRSLLEDHYEVMINHNGPSAAESIYSSLPYRALLVVIFSAVGVVLTVVGKFYRKSINSKSPKSPKIKRHREHIENHHDQANEGGELGISLELSFEDEKHERKMPTRKEIKALVKEMEDNGMLDYECNPSEDTDTEDQYEAPLLPNYFCCMVCFEGTRCTVVEPCRHVFACESCVRMVLTLHKSCLLCTKTVTSYEPLLASKDESSVL